MLFIDSVRAKHLSLSVPTEHYRKTRGGGLMTTFGDLGNYVNGFTCSPQEI